MVCLFATALILTAHGEASPVFEAVGSAAPAQQGRLVRWDPDYTVVLGPNDATVKDAIAVRQVKRPLPPPPTGPQLITTAGDRIAGRLLPGDAKSPQALLFEPTCVKTKGWKVPLSSAAVIWLASSPADTPADYTQYEWLAGNRNRDVIRLRNGDIDRGTLTGLDSDTGEPVFNFRPERGAARALRAYDLAAVAFNPALARSRKPKGPYVRVILADSSRLHITSPSVNADTLSGETLFGLKVGVPLTEILAIDVLQGKAAYLSDLKPRKVEQTGYLGADWPIVPDRTVRNTPLVLSTLEGDSAFDKGLGLHPRSVLTYDLGGKYRRFEAQLGLDPSVPVRGQAVVRIRVDGQVRELPGEGTLTAGKAIAVTIDVTGAKVLELTTDFGPAGGVGADVNWCDARLVE